MKVFVARQPIFDRRKRVFAYELLFREGLENVFSQKDGNYATSKLLSNVYTAIGIESISPNHPIFVNFTDKLLLQRLPLMFPKNRLVVEILENVEVTDEIIQITTELNEKGYKIALDDFFFKANITELIKRVHIIKVDFRSEGEALIQTVNKLCEFKKILLAEKVETEDEYKKAIELGFKLFQGYFFEKPQIITGKDISPLKANLILMLSEIQQESWSLQKLEEYIARDPAITFKLLKYINSAFFGRAIKIQNVKHALTLLGEREIKSFLSMLIMAELARDKPDELVANSVIRAKFCEILAEKTGHRDKKGQAFTTGLFSLLDAMMDTTMDVALAGLPLDEELMNALLGKKNLLYDLLQIARAYMAGEWDCLRQLSEGMGIKESFLPEIYFESLKWANALAEII